jgi:hypothetical protein
MPSPRPPRHVRTGPPRGLLAALYAIIAVETIALVVALVLLVQVASAGAQGPSAGPAASDSATPAPPPALTAAEQLLLDAGDGNSCAVSFAGDAISDAPVLEQQGQLYQHLPIPRRDGAVFAGWYATPEDAAAFTATSRVNGAQAVACTDQQRTLHGAWKTPAEAAAEDTGVPILMYHQFTTNPEGDSGSLRLNYTYIGDFEQQMGYLAEQRFYLPTWPELSAFIDGALYLPKKSVIVTDDDADHTWLSLAAPVVDRDHILTTSFVITKWRHEGTPSTYVLQRSHTDDMHDPGANGKGRMVNWSVPDIVADMETSAQVLGAKEVMAYPFGHYDENAKEALRQAGFEMARTIEQGYVRPGTDKLALPCIRINYGMTMNQFIAAVG